MTLILLLLALEGRTYHVVPLSRMAVSRHTHVEVCGPVTYVRRQGDGDVHVTLDDGRAKVVVEIIPSLPLPVPRKGQRVRVRGIRRVDERHAFVEVHPAEALTVVSSCAERKVIV